MWRVSLKGFQLMHLNMAHSMVCLYLVFAAFKVKNAD